MAKGAVGTTKRCYKPFSALLLKLTDTRTVDSNLSLSQSGGYSVVHKLVSFKVPRGDYSIFGETLQLPHSSVNANLRLHRD